MQRLLITGASGLIGQECTRLLNNKYEIHGLFLNNKADLDINWHCVNILDIEKTHQIIKVLKPDKLLHLAWETEHGKYVNSYNNIDWAKATFKLAKTFYENDGQRAVFAGTCFEYDWSYGVLKEEKTPLNPSSIYGLSKKYAYDLIKWYKSENNVSMAWGRVFYLYGGNEYIARLVPYVIHKLLNKEKAICSSGEQIRDYLYVEDVAEAFCILLNNDYQGAINISSNQMLKVKDVIFEIADYFHERELVELNSSLDRKIEPSIILGDNSKLLKLDWNQKYNLSSGINKTIKYHIQLLHMKNGSNL